MERMITLGIERGEIRPVHPAVVATIISSTALHLAEPAVRTATGLDLGDALDAMLDALLGGLERRP
jgi:hypothetical protein